MTGANDAVLTRPSEVRRLLGAMDLRPSRAFGQNFLVDANILAVIMEAARVGADDDVVEIGPGLGALTCALAKSVRSVLAVEKDRRFETHLRERFASVANVVFQFGDALKLDWTRLTRAGITRLVSNLPYSSGSAILAELFRHSSAPARLVVTLQLEVARRLTALPGSRDFGLLGVWAQAGYRASVLKTISPTCFYPAPDVRSAVVVLERRDGERPSEEAMRHFFAISKRAFSFRRKQLRTIFSGRGSGAGEERSDKEILSALEALGVDLTFRPEALDADTWVALAVALQRGHIS